MAGHRVGMRIALVLLALTCPAAALAQTAPSLEPVGSPEELQQILEAAEPDCDLIRNSARRPNRLRATTSP